MKWNQASVVVDTIPLTPFQPILWAILPTAASTDIVTCHGHFRIGFFSGFRLQHQFCYTHRQYLYSFGNVRVFSIQSCQLLAYSSIFSWQNIPFKTGTFFSKNENTAPRVPRVNHIHNHSMSNLNNWKLKITLYLQHYCSVHPFITQIVEL